MSTIWRRRGVLAGTAVVLALLCGAVVVFALRGSSDAASVRIEQGDALLDAPLRMEVDGADDGAAFRLTLSATSADGVLWSGSRTVRADDEGRISMDGGSLLASLRPTGVPESPKLSLLPAGDAFAVHLEARAANRVLGEASAVRRMVGEGVSTVELTARRNGLAAHYWTGPSGARLPTAVLALGGSEGGYGNGLQAQLLASHGYPVLQLAYFGAPGLPRELRSIPLEYLARALRWLHARPGVEKVVVVGASRGGELALLVGSTYPALVQGVAAYVPFDAVYPGSWTRDGESIPPASNPDPRIPVERIRGPVLLVGGGQDQVWNSGYGTTAVRTRRIEHGRKDTEALVFENAGHAISLAVPYLPVSTEFSSSGFTLESGGTRQADALARTVSWRRLLALLQQVGRDSG
jgi:dienelactone hydrolase